MAGQKDNVSLDTVELGEEEVLLPGFEAIVDGHKVLVTAVLERTTVIEPEPGAEKVLVNKAKVWVDRSVLKIVTKRAAGKVGGGGDSAA